METNTTPIPQGWKIGNPIKDSDASINLDKIAPIEGSVDMAEQKNTTAQTQITEKLNEKEATVASDVHIENIVIQKKPDNVPFGLDSSDSFADRKKFKVSMAALHIEQIMLSYFLICILFIAIVFIALYDRYISFSLTPTAETQNYVDKGKSASKLLSQYTNIDDYAQWYDRVDILTNSATTKSLISNPRLDYLQKKDVMKKNVPLLVSNITSNSDTLDAIKKEILKYGFIPQELYGYLETRKSLSGIKKRIALLENIKFITAVKVLSYMESFIQSLASYMGKDPAYVDRKLRDMLVDIEKDIMIHTNACFLNPYEIANSCDTIGDFDNFYRMIDTQRLKVVDLDFMKKLVPYVDSKLDETGVPVFSINFSRFDPESTSLDFSLMLSTNSQDEYALNKQGILNPHVYVATNLINLLRQSLLVIGENISANQVKISPRTVKVGNTIFSINSSAMSMSLPIQKTTQREISDFFNSNN